MSWDIQGWRWILWNIFLAVIPVAIAYPMAWGIGRFTLDRKRVPWVAWLPFALVWLAFLPNTCYLLTEWRHFLFDAPMPDMLKAADQDRRLKLIVAAWGLFYGAYSGTGVLCFVLGIRPVARVLKRALGSITLLGAVFYFLASLGVYLGLIVRLNSWDIIARPAMVVGTAAQAVANPKLLMVIVLFAAGLYALFVAGDIWVDGLMLRLRQRRSGSAS